MDTIQLRKDNLKERTSQINSSKIAFALLNIACIY